jgi:replication-associated recombination protein RarA
MAAQTLSQLPFTSQAGLAFGVPLADKYRPHEINSFLGLEKPKKIMQKFAANPRAAAFLFCGPSGTGKTTMSLALCEAIHGELIHIPSQHCSVAELEESLARTQYVPMTGKKFWFVLVDEADQMTEKAQLALLSKLDSTGRIENTVFVFTCNDTERLEKRFLSRCLTVEFSSYGLNGNLTAFLREVWLAEGGTEENAPNFARVACGNVRESLMRLECALLEI